MRAVILTLVVSFSVLSVHAQAPVLSDLSNLRLENHVLKVQLLEQQRRALQREEADLEETFRVELHASKDAKFDWGVRQFAEPKVDPPPTNAEGRK